jgi:hypothetical protein
MDTRPHGILSTALILTFGSAVTLAVLGVVLVYAGSAGETELSFFGQTFKSTSVGIAAVFVASCVIVLNLRRLLDSLDRLSKTPLPPTANSTPKLTFERDQQFEQLREGILSVSDVLVSSESKRSIAVLDFRVTNLGSIEVSINRIYIVLKEIIRESYMLGFAQVSGTYEVDIGGLNQNGDRIEHPVSQVVPPGSTDRFVLRLRDSKRHYPESRGLLLSVLLSTNFGTVQGPDVRVDMQGSLGMELTRGGASERMSE